jgi:hypothetical protein
VPERGWEGVRRLRETTDRRIPYRQNLSQFELAVIVLEAKSNSYTRISPR